MSAIIPFTWHMVLAMAVLAGVVVAFVVLWLTGLRKPNGDRQSPPVPSDAQRIRPRGGRRSRPPTRR